MDSSDLFVLTSVGSTDPALAIAATRFGARGTLDLEYAEREAFAGALARLTRFARGPFGVKLGSNAVELLPEMLGPDRPSWVILAGGRRNGHGEVAKTLRDAGIEVFAEAVSRAEAEEAVG
ncbi:hypothetical protein J0H58_10320, partial [bacterium]|nr:hypothetical protein [bacterium]